MLGAAKNRTASPRETGPAWSVAAICRDHASSAVKVIARRRAPTPSMSAMASGRRATVSANASATFAEPASDLITGVSAASIRESAREQRVAAYRVAGPVAHRAREVGLVHQRVDGARVAELSRRLMRAIRHEASEPGVRAPIGKDGQRLEDDRLWRRPARGLERVGHSERESDRLSLTLGEQDELRPHERLDRSILRGERCFGERSVEERIPETGH